MTWRAADLLLSLERFAKWGQTPESDPESDPVPEHFCMILRRTPAIIALAIALAAPARAQSTPSFPTDDPVLRRIWAVGMDSSRVEQLAATLLDSIGPRLTGTAIQRNAQNWVVSMYRSWGIQAVNERYGTWRGWRRGTSHVDLMSPRVRTLHATMLGFSPGTGGRALTAGTIVLPHF